MNANLYALLRDHFAEDAEQPCLLIPGGPVIHYDDLDATSARIANALSAAGCRPGDRVAVQTEKCWQSLALYLACLRAGLVYLPLNTGYQKSELEYFFADAEPTVIVCQPDAAESTAALRPQSTVLTLDGAGGTLLDRAADQRDSFEPISSMPDDLATIVYTSGTTGRSKGAMLSHRNLASNALTLVEQWGFTRGDVLLHALPVYHVHGLFVACHCALLSGSRMLWLPKFDAAEVIGLLPHATVMMGVPTFYTRLLADPSFDANVCRSMRLFVSGSAPLLPETFESFRARTGHAVLERYGMTETGMNTANPLAGERIPGSVGLPLPGVSVRIVDGDARACGPETVGAIEVKGPNVFGGYWRMPENGFRRSRDGGSSHPPRRRVERIGADFGAESRHRELQGSQARTHGRRPSAQRDGQGAEERPESDVFVKVTRLSESKTRSAAAIVDSRIIPGERVARGQGSRFLRRATLDSRLRGNDAMTRYRRSSIASMNFHSPGSTGVIDSRLPRCRSRIAASSRCARNSTSGTSRVFSTRVTSTLNQRGAARVALGS